MKFETERLILRPWNQNDAQELYELAKDPEIGPWSGWAPHTSVEDSLYMIRNIFSGPMTWCITDKENQTVLGTVFLSETSHWSVNDGTVQFELGFWVGHPFWGKGYTPEACEILLEYAFGELKAEWIWCGSFSDNEKSRRVQEKLDFQYVRTVPADFYHPESISPAIDVCVLKREDWIKRQ